MSEKLRGTTFTTPSEREFAMTRVFEAPRMRVFESWTQPGHIRRWMLGPDGWTMPVCEVDLRPGGSWHFVWRRSDGSEMGMTGEYREIAHPERLVSTERWGGEWPETLNTVTFREEDRGTEVTMTVLYPSRAARDAAMQTGMKDGAGATFERLETYLRGMA